MKKCFLALALCAGLAFPQVTTSRLDGTVTDPTGAAVPGATDLKLPNTRTTSGAITR